jgi:hypothetical protein
MRADRQHLDDPRSGQHADTLGLFARLMAVQLDQVRPQDQGDLGQQGVVGVHRHRHDLRPVPRPLEQGRTMQRIDVAGALLKHHGPDEGRAPGQSGVQRFRRGQAADLGVGAHAANMASISP